MKQRVIVSRKWEQPEITAFVHDQAVGAVMTLEDFLKSLIAASGKPELADVLIPHVPAVLEEMKMTTKFVV